MDFKKLDILSKKCRYDIVRMIGNAKSGHIGGAMSSVDIYVLLYNIMSENDRLVVSHGHTSAALYSVLGNMGYFDIEEAIVSFRKKTPFEGHPSISVNGVEWCNGSLGQGLSVACGFALAKKLKGEEGMVYVVMGDGEQQKGQLQEAREFAVKYNLDNLVAFVDCNGLQASGCTDDIKLLADKYSMSGWRTITVDGHSFESLCDALSGNGPLCILAQTVMGKGIPEIENNYKFHGTVISDEIHNKSLERFKLTADEEKMLTQKAKTSKEYKYPEITIKAGRTCEAGEEIEVRAALGNALADIAAENPDVDIAVFDCDLEGSLKLEKFKALRKESFIECGIAEHNAASVAGALAKCGMISVHADFSMFNIVETYSQNRMSDINKSPVKLFCTHAGLDVGEDGKTHQCIDYLGLLSNLFGFEVIVPADANQADAAVRYALSVDKAVAVISGRSKKPVLTDENGNLLGFEYKKADWLRTGQDGTIITYGNLAHKAVKISDDLKGENINIGVLNVSTPVDIDEKEVINASKTGFVITYEDHNVKTGVGSMVANIYADKEIKCKLIRKGINKYGASMSPDKLYAEQGLDEENIKNIIKERLLCKK